MAALVSVHYIMVYSALPHIWVSLSLVIFSERQSSLSVEGLEQNLKHSAQGYHQWAYPPEVQQCLAMVGCKRCK